VRRNFYSQRAKAWVPLERERDDAGSIPVPNGHHRKFRFEDHPTIKPKRESGRKKQEKKFKAHWVKLPRLWIEKLSQTRSVNTIHLAHLILIETYERKHTRYNTDEITLSTAFTGMNRETKRRAARELEKLGLVQITHDGNEALRVRLTRAGKRNTSQKDT
jgi:hypothetical protein